MTFSLSSLKSKSLSAYIIRCFFLAGCALLVLIFMLLTALEWQTWNISIALAGIGLIIWLAFHNVWHRILSSFERALLHLEAVKMEDYKQFAKSDFQQGCSAELHQQLKKLSEHLQTQKSRYDQHAFLLYQLIDQLDTPIMVFNQKLKLTYANTAFSLLYGQPWQMYRMASPNGLGLSEKNGEWQLNRKDQQWQISQSEFIDTGETHQLLVFTNIDLAIRASQQSAWQQIIRVMGHEIRNSLTPVSSLAESLTQSLTSAREQQALAVISERCQHLQDFINRYSTLSQQLDLHIQPIDSLALIERIKPLFSKNNLSVTVKVEQLLVDAVFIEQVLINVIKNAVEANASEISLHIAEVTPHSTGLTEIVVKDNGQGLANTDNLFVPLFTTKTDGQGIGLTFCRNIVEQHNGTIELFNNRSRFQGLSQGATSSTVVEDNLQQGNDHLSDPQKYKSPKAEQGVSVVIKLPNTRFI